MDTRSHFVVPNSAGAILKQRQVYEKCVSVGLLPLDSFHVSPLMWRVGKPVSVQLWL